jgi:thiol-disulfide isomerase/thioredoxin
MGVTGGLIALAAVLTVATVAGVAWQRRAGRFRAGPAGGAAAGAGAKRSLLVLTEADLGGRLGEQATLVQFSTAFCAPCRPTRQMLARVAEATDGVAHIEIDAAARLDLARRLHVTSTPTILVLGPDGAVVQRAVGQPRQADVLAALGTLVGGGSDSPS